MADNTFRTTRRDPAAQGGQQMDDPLAELARLIGQGEPVPNPDRAARHYDAPPLNDPAPDSQGATDDRYAEQQDPARYDERQARQAEVQQAPYDERYDAPRFADPDPPYRPAPPTYDAAYEQPDEYAAPVQRYDARGYPVADQAADQAYDDAHDSIQDLPSFLPRPRNDRYDYAQDRGQEHQQDRGQVYAEDQQGDPDDPSYALEDYEEDEAPPRKRRGFAIVAALLGLMVLGTAGAFAYRAMFGGSMLPSLPPIIKADNTPTKIVPAAAGASGQANASDAGSPDKLVSREEKPVDVPTPANTPRVVSTIPIFPDPNAGLQSSIAPGSQGMNAGMAGQNISGAVAPSPAAGGPGGPLAIGPTGAASYGGSVAPAPTMPLAGMAGQGAPVQTQQAVAPNSATKKVHTVAIHPGQPDGTDAAAVAPAAAPARALPASAPSRPAAPRPLAVAPAQGGNAPLSIVPSQGDTAAPARTHTALARPTAPVAEPAPTAGGGYSVQVSSQRSEAEAQAAYRGLQAKYPSQLGGHTSSVRQVNLGDKGVFYRTLVGPYASMEQAAQMCSSLKAAGGSCIVQRN
jgi:hypothetical protein